MAGQYMEFQYGEYGIDFSRAYSDKTILVRAWGKGNSATVKLDKENLIELRKWVSRQIREMDAPPKTEKKKL